MTWKEIKTQIEAQGVDDDTEISYIDISYDSPIHVEIPGFCSDVAITNCPP